MSGVVPPSAWRERWRGSLDRRIVVATLTVGTATLFVRVAALARETVIAREFGVGNATDAFFIAYMIPAFVVGVLAGSLNAALIPTYLRVREEEGPERAQELFSSVTLWSSLLLIASAVALAGLFPLVLPLIASDFDTEKLALTTRLFYVLLPWIVLSGVSTTWAAVLNAGERFAYAALTPVATPLITIAIIVATAHTWGVYGIVGGALIGGAAELALLGLVLRRHGMSVRPGWSKPDPSTRFVLRQYVPMTIGSILMGSTLIVDGAMATTLGKGAVSALNYGQRVVSFVLGVTAIAVGTAVLPYFSQLVALEAWGALRRRLVGYALLLFCATAPLVAVLWAVSPFLVRTLFESGAFNARDAHVVIDVQRLFALQIPFYLCGIVAVRIITAVRATVVLMWGALVSTVVNIALNWLLMTFMGVKGIALSTSCVYLVSFVFLFVAAQRRMSSIGSG